MQVVNPFKVAEIVDGENFSQITPKHEMIIGGVRDGIDTLVAPVDLTGLREFRFVTAPPGTKVPPHSHEGPLFRIITDGSMEMNGKTYSKGDWMVIPANTEYSIDSPSGYSSAWVCIVCSN